MARRVGASPAVLGVGISWDRDISSWSSVLWIVWRTGIRAGRQAWRGCGRVCGRTVDNCVRLWTRQQLPQRPPPGFTSRQHLRGVSFTGYPRVIHRGVVGATSGLISTGFSPAVETSLHVSDMSPLSPILLSGSRPQVWTALWTDVLNGPSAPLVDGCSRPVDPTPPDAA